MNYWRIHLKIEADDNISEDEIINILEEVIHPNVESVVVSKTEKYQNNKFFRGFRNIRQNFRWWKIHTDSRPSGLVNNSMFWDILCSY